MADLIKLYWLPRCRQAADAALVADLAL